MQFNLSFGKDKLSSLFVLKDSLLASPIFWLGLCLKVLWIIWAPHPFIFERLTFLQDFAQNHWWFYTKNYVVYDHSHGFFQLGPLFFYLHMPFYYLGIFLNTINGGIFEPVLKAVLLLGLLFWDMAILFILTRRFSAKNKRVWLYWVSPFVLWFAYSLAWVSFVSFVLFLFTVFSLNANRWIWAALFLGLSVYVSSLFLYLSPFILLSYGSYSRSWLKTLVFCLLVGFLFSGLVYLSVRIPFFKEFYIFSLFTHFWVAIMALLFGLMLYGVLSYKTACPPYIKALLAQLWVLGILIPLQSADQFFFWIYLCWIVWVLTLFCGEKGLYFLYYGFLSWGFLLYFLGEPQGLGYLPLFWLILALQMIVITTVIIRCFSKKTLFVE